MLTYPEGTAAAEVLVAGEERGAQAKLVFQGLFVGLGYKLADRRRPALAGGRRAATSRATRRRRCRWTCRPS